MALRHGGKILVDQLEINGAKAAFTVPGDGDVDFAPVLETLRSAAYAGWLVVEAEQDPAKAHPLTYARLGYENLRRQALAAGFAIAA